MSVREIHIENIRGFDEAHLDLDRGCGKYAGWTVIAGPNGTGKSTLLRAIALAVAGPSMANKVVQSFVGWIREGAREAKASLLLVSAPGDLHQSLPAAVDRTPEAAALPGKCKMTVPSRGSRTTARISRPVPDRGRRTRAVGSSPDMVRSDELDCARTTRSPALKWLPA